MGENISQTLQFVTTKNAQMGFVALAQMYTLHVDDDYFWQVPQELHDPLEQQGVILKRTAATLAFVEFMRSEWAQQLMIKHGYNK
jgi:molybdenum ABC transporter molybdate-binding protein